MVIKLKLIPKLLGIIKKYESDKHAKPILSYVEKTFNNSPVEEATYPDFNELSNFCHIANILNTKENIIELTELGGKILDAFEKTHSFDSNLKKIFRDECFLDGFLSKYVRDCLSRFIQTGNEIWAPSDKVFDLFPQKNILSLLYECDLLLTKGDKVQLNPQYSYYVRVVKEKQVRLSQKQIDSQLKLMKKIGEIAENLAVEFEQNRLKIKGFEYESNKVQRISQEFANAGYDVASFDGRSPSGEFDRFIEVKGSSGKELDFHWSENEKNIASELKERYWIYFFPQIDADTNSSTQEPVRIQNPASVLFSNTEYSVETEGYHVRKSLKNLDSL
jgi:hypothetical protein